MALVDEKLEALKELSARESAAGLNSKITECDSDDFEKMFFAATRNVNVKTISLSYSDIIGVCSMQVVTDHGRTAQYSKFTYPMSAESYERFCVDTLKLHKGSKYNDAASTIFQGGITARVFAIMPPYIPYPLIVISTVKAPPASLKTLSEKDEKLLGDIIINNNVLVAGKSGSGKTYLLNYLLKRYMPNDKRIGIIQEFDEILQPNEFTDVMITPPHKPGQGWCDLEFLTEQSNLMRYDVIIVGELKSSESWPFIVNCASGTKGISTIHGNNVQSAMQRLKRLCQTAQTELSDTVISEFIAKAIDYVILVDDAQVTDIRKVGDVTHAGTFQLEDIRSTFEFNKQIQYEQNQNQQF